jgi:hypothetical protein
MAWIDGKALRFFVPALTDVLIWGQPFEGFESLGEIVGHQEGIQVLFQVLMCLVVVPLHGGVFARAVHAFHLAISPGVVGCGEAVPQAILLADAVEHMSEGIVIACAVGELDAVIGEHRMDLLGDGGNPVA